MNLGDLRRDLKNAGLAGLCYDVGYRALNRAAPFMVLKMMRITLAEADPRFLELQPGHRAVFLDEPALRRYALDPAHELTQAFLDQALAKGDRCFAILDGDVLASYGWYSGAETQITEELMLRFDPRWIYMYKGFTLPAYRGLRLHGICMVSALREYTRLGLRGIVGFVEANNYSSLKSGYRMGYADIGRVTALKALRRYWIHLDRGCRNFGLTVTSCAPEPLPQTSGVKGLT
jgi:hypothetical protein